MSILKKIAIGFGGVVLAALLLALTAPKAVHAVVSTLVTVANTATNPVPVHSVDSPALLQAFEVGGDCVSSAFQPCSGTLLTVPAGLTAVVQDVSGYCVIPSTNSAPAPPPSHVTIQVSGVALGTLRLNTVFQYADSNKTTYTFGRPVTLYAPGVNDPNAGPSTISYSTTPQSGSYDECTLFVAGYYIPTNLNNPNLY
jgi:hypothetical protein